jgi:hypothetical protein
MHAHSTLRKTMNARTRERIETLKRMIAEARKALKNAVKAGLTARAHELQEKIARLEKEYLTRTLHHAGGGARHGGRI